MAFWKATLLFIGFIVQLYVAQQLYMYVGVSLLIGAVTLWAIVRTEHRLTLNSFAIVATLFSLLSIGKVQGNWPEAKWLLFGVAVTLTIVTVSGLKTYRLWKELQQLAHQSDKKLN